MQTYIKSLIQVDSTRNKLLTFLNRSWSICGWTLLSLIDDQTAQWHLTLTQMYSPEHRSSQDFRHETL